MASAGGRPSWQTTVSVRTSIVPPRPCPPPADTPDALPVVTTPQVKASLHDFAASLACLRNPDSAATTVGYVDNLDLAADVRAVLFEERFAIKPDESHLPKNNSESAGRAFSGIQGPGKVVN
jgi:hypothetical protein